jgi:hypothetical protein
MVAFLLCYNQRMKIITRVDARLGMSKLEKDARAAMAKHGLSPIENPVGDTWHHTDARFTEEDEEMAELAYWLGGLFIDKQDVDGSTPLKDTYWHKEMTSLDVWKRVARALRVHGLKIVNQQQPL